MKVTTTITATFETDAYSRSIDRMRIIPRVTDLWESCIREFLGGTSIKVTPGITKVDLGIGDPPTTDAEIANRQNVLKLLIAMAQSEAAKENKHDVILMEAAKLIEGIK